MGTDGEVYRCGQIREPSVTSGIEANYGNSMILYGTDPVVVEYDPGTDIVIEKFSFLPVSDDFFQGNQYSYIRPFSGETSFYNEKTGSYDPVDIRKQDFSREELADYIAADGKITVRYTAGSNAEIGVSQTLPLLMVRGGKAELKIQGLKKNSEILRLSPGLIWKWKEGALYGFVGPNGAGKSLLVDMLTGKYPLRDGELTYDFSPSLTKTAYDNIKYIAFRDTYGSADANYYYQQRWNAHDQEDAPLVREVLGEVKDDALRRQLFELFSIEPMLDKKIILLSSGELRKFQLTKALLTVPRILIMDNPFIGLDAPTRELLFNLLDRLTRLGELQIVLVLSMLDDIPSFVTHVVPVEEMKVGEKMEREEYVQAFCAGNQMRIQEEAGALEELQRRILDLPYEHANFTSDEVVKLNGVSIRYDDRTILKELDWTVMRGEKWALSGENGAGKSTLLSLVCADNPQSYACDISLFGRKRGTGRVFGKSRNTSVMSVRKCIVLI